MTADSGCLAIRYLHNAQDHVHEDVWKFIFVPSIHHVTRSDSSLFDSNLVRASGDPLFNRA